MVHQVKKAVAIRIHTHCWINDGMSISVEEMTLVQSAKVDRAADRRTRIIRLQITMTGRRVLITWSPMELCAITRYEWSRGASVSVINERL
ncbi:hypothetical protein TNCV_5052791 [Trichonephila clavipes]|nr:hypothetical protein TNCV_5052791 [Trichonephila clavipes]